MNATQPTLWRGPGASPVIKWAGGKRTLLPHLLLRMPPGFRTYYEPFFGGGALYFSVAHSPAVLGDANAELVAMYTAIRDTPGDVMRQLRVLQPDVLDSDRYYSQREIDPQSLSPAKLAARFIYLNKTCYNGLYRVNRAGQFNVPFGRHAQPPALYSRENILRVAEMLCDCELVCGDFEATVGSATEGDLVYLDPPYSPLTATANFTRYTAGAFEENDQVRLARMAHRLHERGCFVLISNSDTPLVRELYGDLKMTVVQAPRNINSDAAGRARVAELIIQNY